MGQKLALPTCPTGRQADQRESRRSPSIIEHGLMIDREQNSAWGVLIDVFKTQGTPGTGVAARPKPLLRQRSKSNSVSRENPTTAS